MTATTHCRARDVTIAILIDIATVFHSIAAVVAYVKVSNNTKLITIPDERDEISSLSSLTSSLTSSLSSHLLSHLLPPLTSSLSSSHCSLSSHLLSLTGAGDEAVELSEEEEKARKVRRIAAKLNKAKVAAYLMALADQKKKEEMDRKKKEESKRKRVMILSARVASEAVERKAMCSEDKPIHQQLLPVITGARKDRDKERDKERDKDRENKDKEKDKDIKEKEKDKEREKERRGREGSKDGSPKMMRQVPSQSALASCSLSEKDNTSSNENKTDKNDKSEIKTDKENKDKDKDRVVNRVSSEQAEAMVARLSVKSKMEESIGVPARDFADWKRKNAVPQDAQVFAMTGWYPCVKQALLDRGWHYNPDPLSPYFDLKWTLRSIDVSQEQLQAGQLTNHFLKNVAITTKVGLIKSLQSLVWVADVHSDDIIPRCYDLSNPQDTQAFIDDFRYQKAECHLKAVYKRITGMDGPEGDQRVATAGSLEGLDRYSPVLTPRHFDSGSGPSSDVRNVGPGSVVTVNGAVFNACCAVLERLLRPLDDRYLDNQRDEDSPPPLQNNFQNKNQVTPASGFSSSIAMTPLEWELIGTIDMYAPGCLPPIVPEAVD